MLTVAFIAFAGAGCLYVLVGAFLGHHFDAGAVHGHGGSDGHDAGHAGAPVFHVPLFSPLALATLLAMVGGYGLIALHGFHLSETMSVVVAVPLALASTYAVAYAAFRLTAGSKASTLVRAADVVGAIAEVTTPIPAGGVGEAVAVVGGQRLSGPAREERGRDVPRGAAVTVVRMVGPTLVVSAGETLDGSGPGR